MTFNTLILCTSAFLVQSIAANYLHPSCGSASISDNGGPLLATSFSPVTPAGLAVSTDLALDGKLEVCGALPFLSAVSFEGSYPSSGSAAVSYGCGDGCIGITQELGNPGNAACGSGLNINSVGVGSCGCF